MIYRIVVDTAKKDFVRAAIDKFFQEYIIIEVAKYKNNIKTMSLIIEIEGKQEGSVIQAIHKTADEIVKVIGTPVSLQMYKTDLLQSSPEKTIGYSEQSKQQSRQPFKKEELE